MVESRKNHPHGYAHAHLKLVVVWIQTLHDFDESYCCLFRFCCANPSQDCYVIFLHMSCCLFALRIVDFVNPA